MIPAHEQTTAEQERLLKRVTSAAVFTAAVLILAKLAAYLFTQSVSVLASLIDSLMDVGASFLNLLAVRYALQPPDEAHRFGHGKAESVAGLAQATFIGGSGVFLVVEATQRLLNPRPLEQLGIGLGVMLFSIVATLMLIAFQHYVVKRTRSVAIKADSLHYKTDVLTNAAIVLALILSHYGWLGVDPVFALAIACYVLWCAWRIGRDAFHDLLDHELPDERRRLIVERATSHPKVHGIHDLRTRMSGRNEHVQLHLELDGELTLREAHQIADEVEAAIMAIMPRADVVIHQDPAGVGDVKQGQLPT
jgi:ferrous-iron efflux pump FieF